MHTRRSVFLPAAITLLLAGSASAYASPPTDQSGSSALAGELAQPVGSNRLISFGPDGEPQEVGTNKEAAVNSSGAFVAYSYAEATYEFDHVYLRDRRDNTTTMIDVRSNGEPGNGSANWASPSGDASLVAFQSRAHDLAGGGRRFADIFLRDLDAGTTTLVNEPIRGDVANHDSLRPRISADGTTVVFESEASNLVRGDRHLYFDIFRRDLDTGKTTLISKTPSGRSPNDDSYRPTVSADGMRIAYWTTATDIVEGGAPGSNIVLYDVATDTSTLVNRAMDGGPADVGALGSELSADGGTVVYYSRATNLVPGDTNDRFDVFAYDVASGQTTLVSQAWNGDPANGDSTAVAVSADGSRIAFGSFAWNLERDQVGYGHHVHIYDVELGTTTQVSKTKRGRPANGISDNPALAGNGSIVAYESDATNLVGGTDRDIDRVYAYRVW